MQVTEVDKERGERMTYTMEKKRTSSTIDHCRDGLLPAGAAAYR